MVPPRPRSPLSLAAALLALAALLAVGCKRSAPAGRSYACDCELLTDTDGVSTVRVAVCEADASQADRAARGCAQSGAPAQIQSCSCHPGSASDSCTPGSCKVEEHR